MNKLKSREIKFWEQCYLRALDGITRNDSWNGLECAAARRIADWGLDEYRRARKNIIEPPQNKVDVSSMKACEPLIRAGKGTNIYCAKCDGVMAWGSAYIVQQKYECICPKPEPNETVYEKDGV